jgi:hypothetical protein
MPQKGLRARVATEETEIAMFAVLDGNVIGLSKM